MKVKTYVLLPHTHSSAPIHKRINKTQRTRLVKRPVDQAYLQLTYQEEDRGDDKPILNRTIRLKHNSDTIYQDEQIKNGIPANTPYTQQERLSVTFIYGVLIARRDIVQKFLDASPQNKKFKGICDQIKQPLFEEYDRDTEVKEGNSAFLKRVKAANRIAEIANNNDLRGGQDLMVRLNGTFFKVPTNVEDVVSGLIAFLDNAEEAGLDKMLDDTVTKDDEVSIIISRALAAEILSFTQSLHQVSLLKNKKWIDVKMISSENTTEERQRFFAEFLASNEGAMLLSDIKGMIEGEKPVVKKGKQ